MPLLSGNTPCYCDSAYHPQGHPGITFRDAPPVALTDDTFTVEVDDTP